MEQVYNFSVSDKDDTKISMDEFKGKVLLIVNTASKCGFTPQYEGLNELHQKYHDRGFSILAFPAINLVSKNPDLTLKSKSFAQLILMSPFLLWQKLMSMEKMKNLFLLILNQSNQELWGQKKSNGTLQSS